ncbi:hypothetical protein [Candidatus Marimicrobium litorale]|uniref:Uncharacterized protein n=1 Tax=Candidatus Marimicrobium litorale TaxID=2518991 RepID=A0ABT3T9V0_9GAMM|nr:hypothetical protein [Candidatus Marimicrobium litorale]MCX2978239.1 hypothetical protein [Candidatus Marimicrobium litorale]
MLPVSLDKLKTVFSGADSGTSAIRAIVRYYDVSEKNSDINTFIVNKTVRHFRENNKPDGTYRLGHGLELVLGKDSQIWEAAPF